MENKPEFKDRIKTFISYLFYIPLTDKISIPNYRTFLWIFLLVSVIFRNTIITIVLLILLLIIYVIDEFKSKRYIDWYRSNKYRTQREALRKVRQNRKLKVIPEYNQGITKVDPSIPSCSSGDEKKEGQGGSELSPNPNL
jgi:hypothetical protein